MPISLKRFGAVALALGAGLAGWGAAAGQEQPQSILPPGFGEPAPPPRVTPRPTPRATPNQAGRPGARPAQPAPTTHRPTQLLPPDVSAPAEPGLTIQPLPPEEGPSHGQRPREPGLADPLAPLPPLDPLAVPPPPVVDPAKLAAYEMPPSARRSLLLVGPVREPDGLAPDAFGTADGQYLEAIMRRLSAPLPSRWLSILLRRTLASELTTPAHVNGADFAAERAWLLVRMGEATTARAVVQSVDDGNYTPKLYQVALNALLAAGDSAGLCPLVKAAKAATGERGWVLAEAMCAGLAGEPGRAKPLIAAARKQRVAGGIDLQLAQKVVGAGPGGGQAVTIEWEPVDRLTVWRAGLAMATGVSLPDNLLATTGRQVTYWRALSPGVPPAERLAAAEAAAAQGVLSNAALVDLYSALDADQDEDSRTSAITGDLRTAYTGATGAARLAAIKSVWGNGDEEPAYARLVLTAHAAARVPATAASGRDADRLVASMLSAGMDRTAQARWGSAAARGSDAWAMLALADPDRSRPLSYGDLSAYAGAGDRALKQRLFFAGLAGLGRLAPDDIERAARNLDVKVGANDAWSRAIDRAARERQPGTVVLLAAAAMQTPSWRGVPPAMLYRLVTALRLVGLETDARMIAAEALARA